MQTVPLDPHDDARMRAFYDVTWRAEMEDGRPWNGHWTYEELASTVREQTPGDQVVALCAHDGGELVGAGFMRFSLLDNIDKAYVFPMVDPPARGRGVGGVLLEALVQECRARGRTTVTSNAAYAGPERPDAPPVRFAARHGFAVSHTEISRHLRLPVADALLDEVDAEGKPFRDGYTLETFVDAIPDELLPSYCALVNRLGVDAPSGDVDYEEEAKTPDTVRAHMHRDRRIGRQVFYSLALADGEAVAQSDLAVQPRGTTALQWGTFVDREHRGRRLGAAVKVANLRALQAARPDVTEVHTGNADTNRFMVSINERLGFEVAAVCPSFLRTLEK